eukprot:Colp12_sorted_trinity150504_noHs@10933
MTSAKRLSFQPGFVVSVLQIVTANEPDPTVRQSASIYLKNFISKHWRAEEGKQYDDGRQVFSVPEGEKVVVRDNVIEAMIHTPENIRSQLAVALQKMVSHDYPEKWPHLKDKMRSYMNSDDYGAIHGALMALQQVVKKYECKKKAERGPLNELIQEFFPRMYQIFAGLIDVDTADSALMQKLIMRIYFTTVQYDFPLEVLSGEIFPQWMELFCRVVARPVDPAQLPADQDEWPRARVYKAKKWAMHILYRMFSRYGQPSLVTKEYKQFAEYYVNNFSKQVLELLVEQLRERRQGKYLTPRLMQIMVNYICTGVSHSKSWKVLKPHLDLIVFDTAFPLLCHSDADEELWSDDPLEFVRQKHNVFEDYVSPVSAAELLVHEMCNLRGKQTLMPIMQFCNTILHRYQTAPAEQRNPREKDGALHIIGTVADVLHKNETFKPQMEYMLVTHVFPEFSSPYGFLRARACWIMSEFARVEYKDANNLLQAMTALVHCLKDHGEGDDDDDDDDDDQYDDELQEEETYESPIKNVNEYIVFQETLQGLEQAHPEAYKAALSHVTSEMQEVLQEAFVRAQQHRELAASEAIRAQGGYNFSQTNVPVSFNFGTQ